MASSRSTGPSCRDLDNTMRIDAGSCRGGFDFSLLFEETILEILPIVLMLIVVPVRLWHLSQKRSKVVGSWLLHVKLVSGERLFAFFFPGSQWTPLELECDLTLGPILV
jgi:hypothetical protein